MVSAVIIAARRGDLHRGKNSCFPPVPPLRCFVWFSCFLRCFCFVFCFLVSAIKTWRWVIRRFEWGVIVRVWPPLYIESDYMILSLIYDPNAKYIDVRTLSLIPGISRRTAQRVFKRAEETAGPDMCRQIIDLRPLINPSGEKYAFRRYIRPALAIDRQHVFDVLSKIPSAGNPNFKNPDYQSALARRRWRS